VNNIVTRGMGRKQRIVTQGYGRSIIEAVVRVAKRLVVIGQSGTKRALRELEDVIVWAKLIRVNDVKPDKKIEGFIKIKLNAVKRIVVTIAEGISTRTHAAWEDIKITVKRII